MRKAGLSPSSPAYKAVRSQYWKLARRLGRKSWSQYAEDLIIETFMDGGVGSYVDVGAGHPFWGSNSFSFYRRGWSGVLIEANPHLADLLRRKRSRDQVYEAVAMDDSGEVEFFVSETWQLSTASPEWAEEILESGQELTKRRMKSLSLQSLNLRARPSDNIFLSVDVEGSDLAVLHGVDWEIFLPRVICIEDTGRSDAIAGLLHKYGYAKRAQLVVSSIFVHQSHSAESRLGQTDINRVGRNQSVATPRPTGS